MMFIKWNKINSINLSFKTQTLIFSVTIHSEIKFPRILNSKRLVSPQMMTLKIGQGVPDNFRMEKYGTFPYC